MEEAEATLLALGVHSDTGSLTFDSATARYTVMGWMRWILGSWKNPSSIKVAGKLQECYQNVFT